MKRKILLILAAIILPGGLTMLAAAYIAQRLSRTERGRKVLAFARARAPRLPALPFFAPQQKAA